MKEQNWARKVPEIINDHRVPQSEQEAAYLALVRLCHERGEWYPEASNMQCLGWSAYSVRRPGDNHPALEDPKYHGHGDTSEALNRRGRRKLQRLQNGYDQTANAYI